MTQTRTQTLSASAVVSSLYAAFQRGDIPFILSLVAPDATWHQSETLPWGGNYRGPSGAAEFFQKLDAAVETVGFEVLENIEHGDEVFSFGVYKGRGRKSGRVATEPWMFRWRIKDGKIAAYDSYVDSAAMLAAL